MNKPDIMDQWEDMAAQIAQRIAVGDLEYAHDPAEKKPTEVLIREIEEEMLDIPAWMLFMYMRLQAIKANIAELESRQRRMSQMTPVPVYVK